jgi:PleD family two-component response regulator
MSTGGTRVLACTSAEAERRLRGILVGDEVRMALTMAAVMQELAQAEFDLIIIGMLFDESRALELLQTLKSSEKTARIPVVAIHGAKIPKSVSPDLFYLPARALGACDVIDFGAIADDPVGNEQIRQRMRRCAAKAHS